MGSNFPPGLPALTGVTASKQGLTGSLATTAVFTAPVPGIYYVSYLVHLVSTDKAGSLTITAGSPQRAPVTSTAPISTGLDVAGTTQMNWLNAGDQVTVLTTATGLTGTVYDVFVNVFRVL